MFDFPNINPVIFSVGPMAVSWYSLAYVFGILIAWFYANKLIMISPIGITKKNIEEFINWAIISIIIGGRLGHVLFYEPKKYLSDPIEILKTYEGGMSFHGAICGIGLAAYIYSKKNKIVFLSLLDLIATTSTVGIFFGRIANFINAELYGRPTDVPWGVIFPYSDNIPRHPTQLYEAFLEGFILFFIMLYFAYRRKFLERPGKMLGIFLIFYSIFRIIIEFFKEPEVKIGFITEYFTLGQLLCIPMILLSIYLLISTHQNNNGIRFKNKVDN